MGAALLAAENRLSPNNISYVRTQVLNNDPVTDPADLVPEQIYEWQFKCSKDTCSMTADGDKINLTALLGPDGIPAAQEVPVETSTYSVTPGSYCVADAGWNNVVGSISDAQDACNRDNECPGFTYYRRAGSYLLQTNITGTEASSDNSCYQKS